MKFGSFSDGYELVPVKSGQVRRGTREKSEVMGRDSILSLLLRFSGPAIVASVVNASYNVVDTIFVGLLGTEALAAMGVAFPLMTIQMSVGMGIGVGAASLISRVLGSGRREQAERAAGCSITLFLVVSSVVSLLFFLNLESLLRLFGADETVLPFANSYMSVETVFIPLNFLLILLAELVRVRGNPTIASAGMITSGLMNCVWDPILMFGFGLFPAFGIAGAAFATSIGRAIGVSILLIHLISGRSGYQLVPRHFLPDPKIVAEIFRVGVSSIVRINAMSLSQIIATRAAASFGVIPLAALSVIIRASSFAFMPCFGLAQGMLPLVGYNYGARQKQRVGEIVVKAALAGFLWGALCWIAVMLFSTQLMSVFNNDPEFLAVAAPAFRIQALTFFAVGTQVVLGAFFQGLGKGLLSIVVTSSRQFLFLIPCLLIMPSAFGLTGIWAAFPVADALSVVLTLILTGFAFHVLEIPFSLRSQSPAPVKPMLS